jgi:hypothetical protein
MSILPSKRYYVYLLTYPDNRVLYVGKGTGARVMDHAIEARRGCMCRKCKAIRTVWETASVGFEIVFESDSEEAVKIQEATLIYQHTSSVLANKQGRRSGHKNTRPRTRLVSDAKAG